MKKRIFTWLAAFVVALTMVMGGSQTVFAAGNTGYLDWSWQPPTKSHEWGTYGITSPAHKGTFAYVVSYDTIYKIKDSSGQMIDSADLGGNVMWSKHAPTIAGSKIFVPLADSKIAVLDISNTNSIELIKTITYAEGQKDYQSNVRAFYDKDSNAVYLGSWGGTKLGTYVKIDVNTYEVTKIADGRGFYYAGAAAVGDYIVFGSEAVDDDAILYAYNKVNGKTTSKTIADSGSIRSSVVADNGTCYFVSNNGNLYSAVIDADGNISETLITDVGYASTCTPLVYDGYLYVGYQVSEGFDSKGGVKAFDLANITAEPKTFSDVPGPVATLYHPANRPSDKAVYATYNNMPGGIWDVTNGQAYFTPEGDMEQYCMSTIVDTAQRMFYMNDSGNLMAIKNTSSSTSAMYKVTASAGEGGKVSPSFVNVKENGTANFYFAPETGYKVASIKVNGVEQELSAGVVSSFAVKKVAEDTKVEVEFKKAVVAENAIEVSVQQGNKFYLAHEKLNVKSDLAETKGYTDAVDIETVSALDALVAAHIHVYGKDADISQYLTMSGGNPSVVMGYKGPAYSSGFAVNENYAADAKGTGYNVNQAPLKDGDRVDFFWYEDANYMDTVTAFADENGKVFSKNIKESESIDVVLNGYPIMYYGWMPEGAIAGAEIVALEKQADGSYVTGDALKDNEGDALITDTEGKATIKLAPGEYYLTLAQGKYSSKIIMPWLKVNVACDPHDYENGVCKDCGELQVIEDTQIVKETLSAVPEELSGKFNDVDALKAELISRVIAVSGYSAENTEFYDVKLQFKYDGKWIDATEANFPKEGITVEFSYPDGTDSETHDFAISHMFTVTSDRLGTVAGETEQPEVTETETGLEATFNGLSPVSISWTETAADDGAGVGDGNDGQVNDESDNEPKEKAEEATDTGDDFNALLFGIIALTAFAAAAATVFYRRKTN